MLGSDQAEKTGSWFKFMLLHGISGEGFSNADNAAYAIVLKLEDIRDEVRTINLGVSLVALLLMVLIGLLWWKL